ncbi:MAG: amidohydrolase, partial [Nesterenkonia sp.]|nr:amidohydrolase [Nesterenkonia sp.]
EYPHARLDRRYEDAVLLPGFVEAHSHAGTGTVWQDVYVGMLDRTDPEGRFWPGCTTVDEVLDRLRRAADELPDAETPLLGWGLDPLHLGGAPLAAAELDQVSDVRPIHVMHANAHLCAVNSATMRRFGIDSGTDVPGVITDDRGEPTGVLQEFEAMALVGELLEGRGPLTIDATALRRFGQAAVNTGTTTLTDLGTTRLMDDDGVALYRDVVDESYPARLSVFHFGAGVGDPSRPLPEAAARLGELAGTNTDRLRFGHAKLMLDGSIQSFTARLMEPGYYGDQPNGMWNVTAEEYYEAFAAFHRAGALIHVHCNGDEATELFLDTLEAVLKEHPRPDHRHTCTHSQMTTPSQYRRMAALGACANVFANHIWAWGDQHLDITLGPDRARRMNAAATAIASGVPISLHSDSPVTPLGPLATVKHAATRLTMSGRVMGQRERISVQQGLEAMTVGAAHMLKMDHEVGAIRPGMYADFAVLGQDPLDVPPEELGDVPVRGTVVGG